MDAPSTSQFMYNYSIQTFSGRPTALYKWGQNFSHLTDLDWQHFFEMPRVNTNETKLHYLQFRFIHRIIATNKLRHAMGKKESDKCSFCHTESESLEHLFWDCNMVSSFILDVERSILKKQFFFSKQDIFFGFNQGKKHPFNFLILHMKNYIYQSKCKGVELSVQEFLYKFKFVINVERFRAKRKPIRLEKQITYYDLCDVFYDYIDS